MIGQFIATARALFWPIARFITIATTVIIAAATTLAVAAYITHSVFAAWVNRELGAELFFDSEKAAAVVTTRLNNDDANNQPALPTVSPFTEISPFDADADTYSSLFSNYHAAGVLVFDANGDGRQDVYLTHAGGDWTRPTDERGVLKDQPHFSHNTL